MCLVIASSAHNIFKFLENITSRPNPIDLSGLNFNASQNSHITTL